jgi:hypothetical protein
MDYNFQIVLFKNKVKKKIINKFKTHKKAKTFFENLMIESDSVLFPKKIEGGQHSNYELSILEKTSGTFLPIFLKDEIGRGSAALDIQNGKIDENIEKIRQLSQVEIQKELNLKRVDYNKSYNYLNYFNYVLFNLIIVS